MKLENYAAKAKFSQKHMLTLLDYTPDEILQVLAVGLKIKDEFKRGIRPEYIKGQSLGMIFSKSSTRTRVSFEMGAVQMGAYPMFLSSSDIQLGRGETIGDTARVLSRMISAIMIRTFKQSDVEDLAKYGSIPIINGLTDWVHPCQALADIMTFYENHGDLVGKKLAFFGDGNNVCHSLMIICAKLGIDFAVACPEGYMPDEKVIAACEECAKASGAKLTVTHDPDVAIKDALAVYTDVWASMGQEQEFQARKAKLAAFQVTEQLMAKAAPGAIFMHCLPAHRGEEVVEGVIDGAQSAIIDEAENRMHAQKGLMAMLMSGMSYEELMKPAQ